MAGQNTREEKAAQKIPKIFRRPLTNIPLSTDQHQCMKELHRARERTVLKE